MKHSSNNGNSKKEKRKKEKKKKEERVAWVGEIDNIQQICLLLTLWIRFI